MGLVVPESSGGEEQRERRRILVCLDGSRGSEVCVPYALLAARVLGGAVTLVRVLAQQDAHANQQVHDALSWEISRQEAQSYLERFREVASSALEQPVEVRLEQGHPAERIIDLARELEVDLLVLGSHGECGVTPWNLGSTVQQVLAVTRSSVLVVHSATVPPTPLRLKRILVPLDGSRRTESVLPVAQRVAAAQRAEIVLVHVVQEPLPTALHSEEDLQLGRQLAERLELSAALYLERLRQQLEHGGASVRTEVLRHSNERECLLEASQREGVDLIVLSAHGAACTSNRPFGSVSAYLLTHSTLPILVLQDLPECEAQRPSDADLKLAPPLLRASNAPEPA